MTNISKQLGYQRLLCFDPVVMCSTLPKTLGFFFQCGFRVGLDLVWVQSVPFELDLYRTSHVYIPLKSVEMVSHVQFQTMWFIPSFRLPLGFMTIKEIGQQMDQWHLQYQPDRVNKRGCHEKGCVLESLPSLLLLLLLFFFVPIKNNPVLH